MNTWEIAILKSINSLGGEASLQEIYKEIPNFKELTEKHLRPLVSANDRIAYEQSVRSFISNLKEAGELKSIQRQRGRYSLTEKGLKRISV